MPNYSPSIVLAAQNAAPHLTTEEVMAAVQTAPDLQTAVTNAKATNMVKVAQQYAKNMASEPTWAQAQSWNEMSTHERNALVSAGYQLQPGMEGYQQHAANNGLMGTASINPAAQGVGGFLDTLGHVALRGVGDVTHAASIVNRDVLKKVPGFGEIEHGIGAASNWGVNTAQHVVRAADYTMTGGTPGQGDIAYSGNLGLLRYYTDPDQWQRAWDATQNAHTVRPDVARYVKNHVTAFVYQILTATVNGENQDQILKSLGTGPKSVTLQQGSTNPQSFTKEQNAYMQLQTDPEFQSWLKILQDGQLDLGRVVASQGIFHGTANQGVTGLAKTAHVVQNDQIFNLLSGAIDAGVDWNTSPLIVATQYAHAGKAIYDAAGNSKLWSAVGDADAFRTAVNSDPGMNRAINSLTDMIQRGDLAKVLREAPSKWHGIIQDLADHHFTTRDQIIQYFSSDAAASAIREGKIGNLYKDYTDWPRQTMVQTVARRIKVSAADWINDIPHDALPTVDDTPAGMLARFKAFQGVPVGDKEYEAAARNSGLVLPQVKAMARRLTTLTAPGPIDILDRENAATHLQRVLSGSLPSYRVDQLVNQFLYAPTESAKRLIWTGSIEEAGRAVGIEQTTAGIEYMEEFRRQEQLYSIARDSKRALGPTQFSSKMMSPDFKVWYDLSKKSWLMGALNGKLNNEALNFFMQRIWKFGVLFRYGFGYRVAGEEVLGSIFRDGIAKYINGVGATRTANSLLRAIKANADGASVRAFEALAASLPDQTLAELIQEAKNELGHTSDQMISHAGFGNTWQKFIGHVLHNQYLIWAKNTGQMHLVNPSDLEDHLRLAKDPSTIGGVVQEVSAFPDAERGTHAWDTMAVGKKEEQQAMVYGRAIEQPKPGELTTPGLLQEAKIRYAGAAHYAWNGLMQDQLFRPITRAIANGVTDDLGLTAVAKDVLDDPLNWGWAQRGERWNGLDDGRTVGVDASRADANTEWAREAVMHVKALLMSGDDLIRDPEGHSIASLIDQEKLPKTDEIAGYDWSKMPPSVIAPIMVDVPQNKIRAFFENRMEGMVARPLQAVARSPMFFARYKIAYHENFDRLVEEEGLNRAAAESLAHEIAKQKAYHDITPFIHHPELRSQFAVISRNLSPFWFAQEQQMKRWARTFTINPALIREGQLMMQGARASGFVYTDPSDGQAYFHYPGTGFAFSAIQELLGGPNISSDLQGEVANAIPGLNNVGVPSVGPLLTIPLDYMQELWPDTAKYAYAIEGPAGANETPLESLVPPLISRIAASVPQTMNPSSGLNGVGSNTARINATVEAMQYLIAAGHGLPQNATSAQIQAWSQMVSRWAGNFLIYRAVLGFLLPVAPEVNIDNLHLSSDLKNLLNTGLPYNEAIAVFMKEHPNGLPYTLASTKVETSGAYVPQTQSALDWLIANKDQLTKYPAAVPWLMPTRLAKGVWSDAAFEYELADGVRQRLGTTDWADQFTYKSLANQYYYMEDRANAAYNEPGANYSQIKQEWKTWSFQFQQAYPEFADQIISQSGSKARLLAIQQIQEMMKDPSAPKTQTFKEIEGLMQTWNAWDEWMNTTGIPSNMSTQRWNNTQEMLAWGAAYAKAYPDVFAFWNGVLKLETTDKTGQA